jgi:hypothetical protein
LLQKGAAERCGMSTAMCVYMCVCVYIYIYIYYL